MAADKKRMAWKEFMIEGAEKKKKPLPEWFDGISKNVLSCKMATHIGKFSNPDVEETVLVSYEPGDAGYVTTKNTHCVMDLRSPAPFLGTAGLLFSDFDESQSVMEAACNNPECIQNELESMGLPSQKFCQDIKTLQDKSMQTPEKTDERIKQVYFPIGEGQYHLLSVLPASSLLIELRKRILAMNEQRKTSTDEDHEDFGKSWEEIKQLTVIGLGGNNPQNLSILNARQAGKAYLLYSMPPVLQRRQLIYPKRNYFKECLRYKAVADLLVAIHHCIELDVNNVNVRNKIDELVDAVIDYVINNAYALREGASNWTNDEKYKDLNPVQKIWLDNQYTDARKDSEWVKAISGQFAQWVTWAYGKANNKEDKRTWGDEELRYFKSKMERLLKEEERYGV